MNRIIWFLLSLGIVAFTVFTHLDELPLQLWDESRLATNAYEMTHSGNWWVTTYMGKPDMWCTKPPLMVWLMAGSMKLFGYTEFAVRFPSAIMVILTGMLWFWFIVKKWNKPALGFLACTVLVSSYGFLRLHCARTGDYDALLTLCMSGYFIFYYLFLEQAKNKYLFLVFVFLTLGALTKGIAVMLMLPGLFLFTLIEKKLVQVFRSPAFYYGTAMFLVVVLGYYFMREHYTPGNLNAVWENELGGRYAGGLEHHDGGRDYYLMYITRESFVFWFPVFLLGIVNGIVDKSQNFKSFTIYAVITVVSFYGIISWSKTQLVWYDMPAYPIMGTIIAIFLLSQFEKIIAMEHAKPYVKILLSAVLVLLMFLPYKYILEINMSGAYPDVEAENRWMAEYLMKASKENKLKYNTFAADSKGQQNLYYYFVLLERNNKLVFKQVDQLAIGDTIMLHKPMDMKLMQDKYDAAIIDSLENVKVYKVNGLR
jgi:4-amino-4-deoxy-L-arabinose transferase-like glycosyltransferase